MIIESVIYEEFNDSVPPFTLLLGPEYWIDYFIGAFLSFGSANA